MSWLRDLCETYERCAAAPDLQPPLPQVFHIEMISHLEVILSEKGALLGIELLDRKDKIEIPVTEASAARTAGPVPHPLIDKLCYVARDIKHFRGEAKGQDDYLELLRSWAEAEPTIAALKAVLTYVERGTLVKDLADRGLVQLVDGDEGKELRRKEKATGDKKAIAEKFTCVLRHVADPEDAVVRWKVEEPGVPEPRLWMRPDLKASWQRYVRQIEGKPGLCMATGQSVAALAQSHPKGTVSSAFNAKLISQNDERGYTFRGRFIDADQACGVGVEASQKAHAALRWLVARQGHEDALSKTATVAWTPTGGRLPDFDAETRELALDDGDALSLLMQATQVAVDEAVEADVGERYALALGRLLSGYAAKLDHADRAMVIALAPSTPGRMAVTLYRRLLTSEFLERVQLWHTRHAWLLPRTESFLHEHLGAPAPKRILAAAYGTRAKPAVVRRGRERVLASILDGKPVPNDLVRAAVRRAINRNSWGATPVDRAGYTEQLAVACALYRGHTYKENTHTMTLDTRRTSRDYLFGRLLAIAHRTESDAMWLSREPLKRLSTAERLQTRFFERPMTTLKTIEMKLGPYRKRIMARNAYRLSLIERERQSVMGLFEASEYSDARLSGEALLGYACELHHLEQVLKARPKDKQAAEDSANVIAPAAAEGAAA
jgi:CRISPR-associated protein Csd1